MADSATATEQPQTSFEEEQIEDDGLLTCLNEWAVADAALKKEREEAAPYVTAVDRTKEKRDESRAAVNARLTQMEIEIVGTDRIIRCGTYRIANKHRDSSEREFTVKAKDELKIEYAS